MSLKSNVFAFVLLAMSIFASCSVADIPDDGVFYPISAPDNVSAFFEEHLPQHSQTLYRVGFKFSEREFSESECFLINSKSEFKAVVADGVKVPDIDFRKYSLIVGQCVLGDPGYTILRQSVSAQDEEMILHLEFRQTDGFVPCVITNFYFWGLYPKLPDRSLTVNLDII